MNRYRRLSLLLCLSVMIAFVPACSSPATRNSVAGTAEWQGITFVLPSGIGKQWLGKTIPADAANSDVPENWLVATHEEITFPDYPVKNGSQSARILIFPVSAWKDYNPEAETRILALNQLLKDKPVTFGAQATIPVLPVFNAVQVFRAHISYFNFQNGSGVRFITQYDQGPVPINNSELFYTFQAMTTDGNFYVAAFFPITHASLPTDSSNMSGPVGADFLSYLDTITKMLGGAADDSFNPTLNTLDAALQSLKVK